MMLLPNRRLLIAAGLWLAAAVAVVVLPAAATAWQLGGALLLALALADAALARRQGNPLRVERRMAQIWPIGVEQTIRLRLTSTAGGVRGELYDRHPDRFAARALPARFAVEAGHWREIGYTLLPDERGAHRFGAVHLRLASPLGFWQTQYEAGVAETVRVYPNFARIAQYALLATDNRLSQLGVLRRRRRGEGSDFEQLREYRRDDSTRHIDWKATARLRKPIVREFQDERDQQIVFLLDCGQRMRSRDDALSHFDHTLNAMYRPGLIGHRIVTHAAFRMA